MNDRFPTQSTHRAVHRLIAVLIVILIALLTAAFWQYTQDDVFITYAYSRNIARGAGFVFNLGERVQGTTTPLYTLIMAGVSLVTYDLLHVGNALSALLLLLTCGLIWRFTRDYLSTTARAGIVLALAVSPIVYVSFGMETLLYCALLSGAWLAWQSNRRVGAILLAAALTWTRADGVVLGGALILIAFEFEVPRPAGEGFRVRAFRKAGRLAAIYALATAPWFIFAWAYFGTPLPNTFGAKQELLHGVRFWTDGAAWWTAFYGNNPLTLLAVPLIAIGLWRTSRIREMRPLAVWTVLYTVGYTALNVSAFWYYTPLIVALIVLTGFGGDWLARQIIGRVGQVGRRPLLIAALSVIAVVTGLSGARALTYGSPPERVATYTLAGEWINQHTPAAATLGVRDLGLVGYYAQRRTLDSPGLIVPDMVIKTDEYAAAKYKPDYILATQYWTYQNFVDQAWFTSDYVPLVKFSTAHDPFSPMTLYQRRMALNTPPSGVTGSDLPLTCHVDTQSGAALPMITRARLFSGTGVETGTALVERSQPFLGGQYPDSVARTPEHFIEQIALPLTVPPGHYRWQLTCDATTNGSVEVLPVTAESGYQPLNAEWLPFAQINGAALPDGAATWSGGSLSVLLDWHALSTPAQDYSVFVHLVDSTGKVVSTGGDSYPRNGERPTSGWLPGEQISDIHHVTLPPDLPAGTYHLEIGWYDWRTGKRLTYAPGADTLALPFTITK